MPFSAPTGTCCFIFCEEFCDWKLSSQLLQGAAVVLGHEMMWDVREWGAMWGELGCLICEKTILPHGRSCAGTMG